MDQKLLLPLMLISLVVGATFGGLIGYATGGETKVVTEEKVVEVPVEKEVEVVKEVEVEKPVADTSFLLDKAVQTFLDEKLEDLEDCNGDKYDEDQIKVDEVEDDYSIEIGEDTEEVQFKIELKYLDNDVNEKCYSDFDVSVLYEEEEDPVVTIA